MEENATITHNKSGKDHLAFLDMSDDEIHHIWETIIYPDLREHQIIPGTMCLLTNADDGRVSIDQHKVGFGYHFAAFERYGRVELMKVPPKKDSKYALVVSHLCGNGPRCCNPEHLVIEVKEINDERVHCHFCIYKAISHKGSEGLMLFGLAGGCPHDPPCWKLGKA